jgi:hypothetical protein
VAGVLFVVVVDRGEVIWSVLGGVVIAVGTVSP